MRTYTTEATRLKRPAALLTRLLLLCQIDDSQAVSPNFADGDGLKDPKFIPSTVTWTEPLVGNATFREVMLNETPEYENVPVSDPRLSKTDAVTANAKLTPRAVRHVTSVSLCHCVDTHDVAPVRTPPLQSDSPALLPYTVTLICAVEGCVHGDTLLTTRGYRISGNLTFGCVCNGHPPASNVDTLTLAAAAAAAAFVKPATKHTTAAVGDVGVAAVDRFSSSTPEDGVKAADTVAFEGLRLEQEGGAAVALKAEKRKPATDTSLKAVALCLAATENDRVSEMLVLTT